MELQLKQMDCELLIRKKEALRQPSVAAPVFYTSPPTNQAMIPPPMPHANVPALASTPAAMPTPPPAPAKPKSAYPPFKCPMAGNFYRSPAPGAPAFVKVNAFSLLHLLMISLKDCAFELCLYDRMVPLSTIIILRWFPRILSQPSTS